ncbi:MAG: S46 family peptidase [Pseudomonadota bacterium]
MYQWSTQPPDDKDRGDERFKSWNKANIESQIRKSDNYGTLEGEKVLMAKYFEMAASKSIRIRAFDKLAEKAREMPGSGSIYEKMADRLYSNAYTIAANDTPNERTRASDVRMRMFHYFSPASVEASGDTLVEFAVDVVKELEEMRSGVAEAFAYEKDRVNYLQNQAMGVKYPDANGTVRFVVSTVQNEYEPVYKTGTFPFVTTLSSMVARDRFVTKGPDAELFVVPEILKKAVPWLMTYRSRWYYDLSVGNIPINFITHHVITGGMSGSSVFDNKGEVVGFAFDGTPESILDDVWLHPASRAIILDMRFIGFLGNVAFPAAKRVIREMGLPVDR